MKDLLITGWCGTKFAMMASRTVPLMHQYADKHGMAFAVQNLEGPKPPSWGTVVYMIAGLHLYDRVLWLDSDVVVVRSDVNLFDEAGDGFAQAMVEHTTADGAIPNCGVWAVTQEMLGTLQMIDNSERHRHHPWWEQAAILELMGYEVTNTPTATLVAKTPLYDRTKFLSSQWNHHPRDSNKCSYSRFYHATTYDDRVGFVNDMADLADGNKELVKYR